MGGDGCSPSPIQTPARSAAALRPTNQAVRRGVAIGMPDPGTESNAPIRASRTSPRSRTRSCGSLFRQCFKNSRSVGDMVAGRADQSGSPLITAAKVSATVSPANARRPVTISYRTHPKAQTSVLRSAGFPRACSGLMYAAVPMITPICVAMAVSVGDSDGSPSGFGSSAFASPKSRTLTVPSSRTLMFAGLRSRWITPPHARPPTLQRSVSQSAALHPGGSVPSRSGQRGWALRPAPAPAPAFPRTPRCRRWRRCWGD